MSLRFRRFIKAGYVWQYQIRKEISGHVAIREAGLIEALLFRWFGVEPKP